MTVTRCWATFFLFIMSFTIDMSKSILVNGYSSSELFDVINTFGFLSDDEKTLIISKIALFIGLNDNGRKVEKLLKSNINYISDKICQEQLG